MSLAKEIIYGTLGSVERLVLSGASVDEIDEYGFTPLIEAAIVGKYDIATFLIEQGADVELTDATGRSALHWAADTNNFQLVEYLLEYEANPNAFTTANQPVLVFPTLRKQENLIEIIRQFGGKRAFADDYIKAKLMGHRFDLKGHVHIINHRRDFVLVNYEGFFLEFTLGLIQHSLKNYLEQSDLKNTNQQLPVLIKALAVASTLIRYQQYPTDYEAFEDKINKLLDEKMLVIPATYQGHAITFIKYKDYFAKIDRGANSKFEGSVVIYKINNKKNLSKALIKKIIYEKNTDTFMHRGLNQELSLVKIANLPIGSQITGNCSWANVEGALPTMVYLLLLAEKNDENQCVTAAMDFYNTWRAWDKETAIDNLIEDAKGADRPRVITYVSMLSEVLFQTCKPDSEKHLIRARKILSLFIELNVDYIIESYIETYYKETKTQKGIDFIRLLADI